MTRSLSCAARLLLLACALLGCAGLRPESAPARPAAPRTLSAEQLIEIASVLEARGDTLRASQYLSLALAQRPRDARIVPRLLGLYVRDGQYRLAAELAENHLRKHPRDLRTRFFLGSLYAGLGLVADAVRQYERVLAQDEGLADAHFALASLLHDQGKDRARADVHYRAYLRLRPAGEHAEAARAALLTELP